MATSDDVYEGYFIPKGTMILGNAWYVAFLTPRYQLHKPHVIAEC
jgi:hypothetical protein